MSTCKRVVFIAFTLAIGFSASLLAQNPTLPIPLLEYRFDQSGAVVTNTGSEALNLTLLNRTGVATDLHSPPGSGVTAAASDYAFDNTADLTNGATGGIAISTVTPAAVAGLRSFTLTGWIRNLSAITKEEPRIIQCTTGGQNGFQLTFAGNPLKLYINGAAVESTGLEVRNYFYSTTEWSFFAVSWDGTSASDNVTFYRGTPSDMITPVTRSLAQTIVTNTTAKFCIGNESGRNRAVAGMFDDVRLFGSASDSSGALSTFQIDYLRQQTFSPTNERIYLAAGIFLNSLTNLLDNEETTFVANKSNNGVLVWDRRSATPIYDFGLTSRNVSPNAGIQGTPQSWQIEVQGNDEPGAITGWSVVAAATNIFGITDALCQNLGRRVTFAPVTNRYIRWVNTFTGDTSGIASFDTGRQVYVYACSNAVDGTHPINYAADGNSNTFANIASWGVSKTTGLLVLDVLRTNKNDYVTQIRLQHRSDASSDIWPKDYIISVSSTDDPADFDTVVATGQLARPFNFNPNDKGRWWTIDLEQQPKRFFRFEWTSAWNPAETAGAQIAEIAVTSINWVPRGTLIIVQ